MMKRFGLGFVALLAITSVGSANDENFKNAAARPACLSMITESLISECTAIQQTKNTVCNRPTECLPDKQEAWAREYDELYRWWDSAGKSAPDNDYKADRKRKMSELVSYMEAQKRLAEAGMPIAKECITARDNVQKFFENRAAPVATDVKNKLVPMRRALVDKFNETKTKREDAKSKYESGGSKDDNLKREWEAARDANIKAGQELDDFDKKYGPEIQYNFDKLIAYYQSEKTNHDPVSKQAEVRLQKCETSAKVQWKSLPF
jgi:uncharacterized protein (DUF3084 family)